MLSFTKRPHLHFLYNSLNTTRVQTLLLVRHLKGLPSISGRQNEIEPTRDDYYAAIHYISNIVRRDFYLERTLNKLHISVNSDIVYRVLRACSNSGIESLRFFNWARTQRTKYQPTTVEVEELVRTLARTKNYEHMWKILQLMKTQNNLCVSSDTLCFIVEEFGKHGLVDQAVEVFNKAPKVFNCSHNVELYNSLLFALCEVKLFHGAYALIRRMIKKEVAPNKRTYSILVNAWCSAGKMREAQSFLDEMSKKGFNPPARGRDLLVEGILNAGHIEHAKDIVRKMFKEGSVPEIATFNVVIEVISKTGDVEFCIEFYHEACRLGLCPDNNTYKLLISAASKVGRIDEAFRLLHNSIEDGHKPYPSLYAPIVKGMCRKGQFDDAFCFFSEMKVKGHPPNRPVYTMMITLSGRGGRFVEAANYLFEMTELGFTPISRCFDLVTDGLKHCGKHELAKRIEQLEISLRGV